jgi:hypothetical protein
MRLIDELMSFIMCAVSPPHVSSCDTSTTLLAMSTSRGSPSNYGLSFSVCLLVKILKTNIGTTAIKLFLCVDVKHGFLPQWVLEKMLLTKTGVLGLKEK